MTKKLKRKDKKRLRKILLCYTGNYEFSKVKLSKDSWFELAMYYKDWLSQKSIKKDSRMANTIYSCPKKTRKY